MTFNIAFLLHVNSPVKLCHGFLQQFILEPPTLAEIKKSKKLYANVRFLKNIAAKSHNRGDAVH